MDLRPAEESLKMRDTSTDSYTDKMRDFSEKVVAINDIDNLSRAHRMMNREQAKRDRRNIQDAGFTHTIQAMERKMHEKQADAINEYRLNQLERVRESGANPTLEEAKLLIALQQGGHPLPPLKYDLRTRESTQNMVNGVPETTFASSRDPLLTRESRVQMVNGVPEVIYAPDNL